MSNLVGTYGLTMFAVAFVVVNTAAKRKLILRMLLMFILITIMAIPLISSDNVVQLFIVITAVLSVIYAIQKIGDDTELSKLISAGTASLVAILLFSDARIVADFNEMTTVAVNTITKANRAIGMSGPKSLNNLLVYVSGILLSSVEANRVVTVVLAKLKLGPTKVHSQYELFTDGEMGRGRVIGILERSIICVLVLSGNLASIGILLAAKGLVRFRELNSREFAEYVLIGTLLSASSAALIGSLFRGLLE